MFKPKSILVPTDFSEYSEKAYKQAVEIAKMFNSTITVLHVEAPDFERMTALYISEEKLKEIRDNLIKETEESLKKFINIADNINEINIKTRIETGVAYDEIVKLTKNEDYDLIVISSHGKNALEAFFYGSTTEKVVRNAKCSVLVVR
jgi:nucleotide-binding universal stress UspA family protein